MAMSGARRLPLAEKRRMAAERNTDSRAPRLPTGAEGDEERDFMSTRQLAKRLGWSVSTVYRMPLPTIPKGRRGHCYYWPDVLAYLRRDTLRSR